MADSPSVTEIESPQFCPWCGAPAAFRSEAHTPLWERLSQSHNVEAPEVVKQVLHTDAYVGGCPGCRRISHIVGHEAEGGTPGSR